MTSDLRLKKKSCVPGTITPERLKKDAQLHDQWLRKQPSLEGWSG